MRLLLLLLTVVSLNAAERFAYSDLLITRINVSTRSIGKEVLRVEIRLPGGKELTGAVTSAEAAQAGQVSLEPVVFRDIASQYRGREVTDPLTYTTDFLTFLGADGWEVIDVQRATVAAPPMTSEQALALDRIDEYGQEQSVRFLLKRRLD
jgi:hypothetical protein